ncbi:DinB family protein [Dyadobacter tibetensis]|uniref:DinB family protein n=1 Tax=Dyadobacter tibetensis TaxID=1211851 RepID=UPI00046E89F8|nr:DinB family protein [Dyadobacter tibetensis]
MKKSEISRMPSFFDRYINLCDDISLLLALEKTSPDQVFSLDMLREIGDKIYAPGKWTIKDILQHVIDNERIMCYRALRFSRNELTALPGYEENIMAANSNARNRTLEDIMEEFQIVRGGTLALYRNMTPEMMLREGLANGQYMSPLSLGFVIVGHAVHHRNIIEQRYRPLL